MCNHTVTDINSYKNTMTIRQLIAELSKHNLDEQVMFSSDEEGNVLHANADVSETDVSLTDTSDNRVVIYPLNTSDDIT